ncbi:MAG: energy-coupling factor transporter transmembrane protein EcfT [Spirochaetales bacterium]|nr:energy-coupling factor transporter transmembrane protein EcfT [Spirochaetales bacterium]
MNYFSSVDIRPRLVGLILISVLLFLPVQVFLVAGFVLFLLLLSLSADGFKTTFRTLGRILPILILVTLLTPLFSRSGELFLSIRGITIVTTGGLDETVRMISRFTGITLGFAVFFHSTEGDELITGLEWFGLPFRGALVINLALRFIPEMFSLYARVRDAHSLRGGGEHQKRGIKKVLHKFSQTLPHLTSVLILSMKKITPLSMSLHLRGAEISKGRSSYHSLPDGRRIVIQFLILILIIAGITTTLVMNRWVWYKMPV